jgi:hypothetical protein
MQGRLDRFAIVSVAIGIVASGCAWTQRGRAVRGGERLELQSAVVPAPAGPGWTVLRSFDAPVRRFDLVHAVTDRASDRWIAISERDGTVPLSSRETLLARLSSEARTQLGDPAAPVQEIAVDPPPHFGATAVVVVLRAEESDRKAGLLEKHVFYSAEIEFVPPAAPDRTCVVSYVALGTTDLQQERFAESWRALLDGVELRPADETHVEAAARADAFPKTFQPGLARRSLTLPQGGFQWGLARRRWLAPGGFTGSWGLALGITDQLELGTPGFVRFAFGEVEGLTRPELAIGAGLTGFEHDAERGSVWGFGVSLQARRRLAPDVALHGLLFAEGAHESRTGRTRPAGAASAGVVWDVHPLVTLGLESGWSSRQRADVNGRLVWLGGSATPLVTVHLPLVDVGVHGAAAWEDGRAGVIAGASFLLTL